MGIIGQRFRAVESSVLEEGGWNVAWHLEVVPETRVSSVTPGLRAMMAVAERQSHRLKQKRPRDPHWRRCGGYASSEGLRTKSTGKETPKSCPVQRTKPLRKKWRGATGKEKAKAAIGRTQGVWNEQQQRDGLYIGRSRGKGQTLESKRRYVSGSAKGCRNFWEHVKLARWAMASVATLRRQIESLRLPLPWRSAVSWRCGRQGFR